MGDLSDCVHNQPQTWSHNFSTSPRDPEALHRDHALLSYLFFQSYSPIPTPHLLKNFTCYSPPT